VSFLTAHLNSPRLTRIRVVVNESIKEDMMSLLLRGPDTK